MRRVRLVWVALVLGVLSCELAGQVRTVPGKQYTALEALRIFNQRKRYDLVIKASHGLLWDNIKQPEILYLFSRALEKTGKKEDASVFYTILLRVLETSSPAEVRRYKKAAETRLKVVNRAFEMRKSDYERTAKKKAFSRPGEVDDLWMTQVRCDVCSLHGLYAWKMVGGRKDVRADWIHNTQGVMHQSCAKRMDKVNGRKGVLFCSIGKKSKRLSRMIIQNSGHGKFLRIGTQGYNFAYLLNVVIDDKQVFSKTIGKETWEDLKIPLGEAAGKKGEVVLELVVPEEQRWYEGAWLDYVDFFED